MPFLTKPITRMSYMSGIDAHIHVCTFPAVLNILHAINRSN